MTTPPLPADIEARVAADYPPDRHLEITEALRTLHEATREPDRVARCVLHVANGNLEEFDRMLELARTDYRDAIVAAEYARDDTRLRDFTQPFGIERPPIVI